MSKLRFSLCVVLLVLFMIGVGVPVYADGFFKQESYNGVCKKRPPGSVCVAYKDGYIWLVCDSITGWGQGKPFRGKDVQIAHGAKADYYHVLETKLIRLAPK